MSFNDWFSWKKIGELFTDKIGNNVAEVLNRFLFNKTADKSALDRAVQEVVAVPEKLVNIANMMDLENVSKPLGKIPYTSPRSFFKKNVCPVVKDCGKWFPYVKPMHSATPEDPVSANKELGQLIDKLSKYLDEVGKSKKKLTNFEDATTLKVALTVYLIAVMEAALEKNKKTIQSGLGAQSAQIAQKRNETIKKSANARYDKEKIERAQQLKEIGEAKRANASEIEKYKPLKHRYALLTNLFGCLASLAAELKLEYKEKDYSAIDKTVEKYRGRLQGKMDLRGIVFNKIQKNSDETMNTLLVATGKSNFDDLIKHFEGAQTDCKNALEKYADILDCYMAKDVSKQDIETTVRKLKEEVDAILKGKFGYTDKPYTGVPYAFISYLYSESPRLNKVPRILQ